jgi:hypothetical protein
MSLRSRRFEQALRRRVQQEVRASPALAREYRRERRRFWRDGHLPSWVFRPLLCLYLIGLWCMLLFQPGQFELGLAVLALWCLGTVGTQASRLWATLYRPADLNVLVNLPLSDAAIFARQRREFLRCSLGTVLQFIPAGGALLVARPEGWAGLGSVLLPPFQAVLALSVAVHVAAFWPRLGRFLWLALPASVMAAIFATKLGASLDPLVLAAWWLPPFGWVNHAYENGLLQGDAWALTLLLPAVLALWALPLAWQRLRANYALGEPTEPAGDEAGEELLAGGKPTTRPVGRTELEDRLRAREFLRPLDWSRCGWIERLAVRCLTPRERLVAEFMAGDWPGWTRAWVRAVWVFPLSLALVVLFGRANGAGIFFAFLVLGGLGAPFLGGDWRGFQACCIGNHFAPACAGVPLGFSEIARVLLKVNTLRWLAAAPLLLALGAAAGWRVLGDWLTGLDFALRGAALCLVMQPVVVSFRFTGGERGIRWRNILILLVFLLVLVPGCFLTVFFPDSLAWAALWLVVNAAGATAIMWLYKVAWGRGWLD